MNNKVILVDLDNNKVGIEDKIEAHKKSLLHRAFSVFIFNQNKEILLQKRSKNKYHSWLYIIFIITSKVHLPIYEFSTHW